MLPSACGISLYGPPSWQITYISFHKGEVEVEEEVVISRGTTTGVEDQIQLQIAGTIPAQEAMR